MSVQISLSIIRHSEIVEDCCRKHTVQTSVVNSADSTDAICARYNRPRRISMYERDKNLSTTQSDNIQISSHSDDDYHAFKWAVSETSDESTKSTNIEIYMNVKSYEKQFWENKWLPTHCTFTRDDGHLHFKDTVVLPKGMGMVSVKKKRKDRYDVYNQYNTELPVAELKVSEQLTTKPHYCIDIIASEITHNDNWTQLRPHINFRSNQIKLHTTRVAYTSFKCTCHLTNIQWTGNRRCLI